MTAPVVSLDIPEWGQLTIRPGDTKTVTFWSQTRKGVFYHAAITLWHDGVFQVSCGCPARKTRKHIGQIRSILALQDGVDFLDDKLIHLPTYVQAMRTPLRAVADEDVFAGLS